MRTRRGASRFSVALATLVGVLLGTVLSWVAAVPEAGAAAGPGGFTPLTPVRLLDTRRAGEGPCVTTRDLVVAPAGGGQRDAATVQLNVTVTGATTGGFLTVYPTGSPRPTTSSHNYNRSQTVANAVTTKVGTGGRVTFYSSSGCPHVVVDIAGFTRAPSGAGTGQLVGVTPTRLRDTRLTPAYCTGRGGGTITVPVGGVAPVPAGATAAMVNLTVATPNAGGYVTAYPAGTTRPTTSNVNFVAGQVSPTAALVRLGTGGALSVFASAGCPRLIVDVTAYVLGDAVTGAPVEGAVGAGTPVRVSSGAAPSPSCEPERSEDVTVVRPGAVPADAAAAVLSVTAVNPASGGFLTVFPFGRARPTASNLNYDARRTTANLVVVPVNAGKVTVYASSGCPRVVVDVLGWTTRPSVGSTTPVPVPLLNVQADKVAAGRNHTCARMSGSSEVRCWGANDRGQLGAGNLVDNRVPAGPVGLGGVVDLSAGADHTCVVVGATERLVRCWGANDRGQLGNGTFTDASQVTTVTGITTAVAVAAGDGRTCALLAGGTVTCWGQGANGGANSSTPVAVAGLTGATKVATGRAHSCAVVTGGAVRCWGANARGQLGGSTTSPAVGPVDVVGVTGTRNLSAGPDHTCAQSSGAVRCWGANSDGQLGDGSTTDRSTPVAVTGMVGPATVSAGDAHTCALDVTGFLGPYVYKCWGSNEEGQLGNNSTTASAVPVPTVLDSIPLIELAGDAGGGRVVDAAGGSHSCVVRTLVEVACWGSNARGQLGPGGPL